MSTMNPLKFVGGLVLEIGAVIAVLAIIPGLGGSEALRLSQNGFSANSSMAPNSFATSPVTPASLPNEVFFDAQSPRVLDNPNQQRPARPTAWQNDLVPPPPVAQQRYVEQMLDHNSQRALDAAARVWSQGDRLLPPELRVRREAPIENLATNNDRAPQHAGEPIRDLSPRRQVREYRTEEYRPDDYRSNNYNSNNEIVPEYVVPPTVAERNYSRPSHYAPVQRNSAQGTSVAGNSVQGNPAPSFTHSRYSPPSNPAPRYSAYEQPRRLEERY